MIIEKIPYIIMDKSSLQKLRDDLEWEKEQLQDQKNHNTDLIQTNTRLSQQCELLESKLIGEARLTMRSVRRANALRGLLLISLLAFVFSLALWGKKKLG